MMLLEMETFLWRLCQLTCQRRCRDRSGTACGRTREREWSASGGKGAQNQYRGWISAVSLY
jgi:hypothetical protein